MQDIAAVWKSTNFASYCNRHIIRLHSIFRNNNPHSQIMCVSIEFEMHRHLMHTQIGTVTYDNGGAQIAVCFQPCTQSCVMKGIERVLCDNGIEIGKGQARQLRNSLSLACTCQTMRWKICKFN